MIGIAAALFGVAVVGKLVSAFGLGRSSGDRVLVGIGMIPRGEVGLIFATLGLRQHVFGQDVYAALLLVVLATTLVPPPALRWRLMRMRARPSALGAPEPEPPKGWLEVRPREHRRVDVAPEVVHAGERFGPCRGEALPHSDADQQAADQAWAAGDGQQVDVVGLE